MAKSAGTSTPAAAPLSKLPRSFEGSPGPLFVYEVEKTSPLLLDCKLRRIGAYIDILELPFRILTVTMFYHPL